MGHEGHDKKHEVKEKRKVEMGKAARVLIEQAIQTATQKVPGKVIEAELENKHGKTVWEVEIITSEDRIRKVYVDGETGALAELEEASR